MINFRFLVNRQGSEPEESQINLGDPYRTEDPTVYACQVKLGAGPARAIFGSTPLGAVTNALTVANALVEGEGDVCWI
jgi:hypothetical protein